MLPKVSVGGGFVPIFGIPGADTLQPQMYVVRDITGNVYFLHSKNNAFFSVFWDIPLLTALPPPLHPTAFCKISFSTQYSCFL